jgi:hypothetical protein
LGKWSSWEEKETELVLLLLPIEKLVRRAREIGGASIVVILHTHGIEDRLVNY